MLVVNKAVLVSKLAIFTPSFQPNVTIIDGDAKLYHVTWPKSGTVRTKRPDVPNIRPLPPTDES